VESRSFPIIGFTRGPVGVGVGVGIGIGIVSGLNKDFSFMRQHSNSAFLDPRPYNFFDTDTDTDPEKS
jgi:hypothetical protein